VNKNHVGNLDKLPTSPKSLGDAGKKKWRKIGNELIAMGIMDRIDLHALEHLCEAYDLLSEAKKILSAEGLIVVGEKGKYPNSAWLIACNAEKRIEKYISMLGMTKKTRVPIALPEIIEKQKVAARKR
jgi:P27 family predicted phage terminase small subunit